MVDGKMPGSCSLIHLLILSILAVVNANDEFHEELLVKPLASGHVYTHFQFTTKWDLGEEDPGACEFCIGSQVGHDQLLISLHLFIVYINPPTPRGSDY